MGPGDHRGNALFIILIALALFAALSYAVTQSGRGGASADKERTTLDAARVTQYATLLNSTVQRMVLTGTNAADITFCSSGPGTLCKIYADDVCTSGVDCVFAPEGGGLPPAERYIHPECNPGGVLAPPAECPWVIDGTANWGTGTSATDTVLVLLGAPIGAGKLCTEVNQRLYGGNGDVEPIAAAVNSFHCTADWYALISLAGILIAR